RASLPLCRSQGRGSTDALERSALRGAVRAGDDPVLHGEASAIRQRQGDGAEPRAPQGGRGPHARSREAAARLSGEEAEVGIARWIAMVSLSVLAPVAVRASGGQPTDPASFGIYYDRREPSFYTGFAPRTPDPSHLHLHIGRGNQLRVTAVLADDVLRDYA